MTPVPATRPASNSRAATPPEVMLVLTAVPREGLGTQRIKGTSPEIPTSHGAAVEPIASGDERTWRTRTPGWRHPTTHTTQPAEAIAATAPRPAYGPPPDSAPHTVGARAPRDERGQEVQSRFRCFGQTCEHLPSRAQSLNTSVLVTPSLGGAGIVAHDSPARGRAHQVIEPLPACFRLPSFDKQNTSFVRRGPSPRRHVLTAA